MSRDKLPGFAFLSQNAAFLQWYLSKRCVLQWCLSGASVVPQLCLSSVLPPVSLKCPEISSLTLRFCLKNMMDMMAQRCLLVQLYVIQFLSNVPR